MTMHERVPREGQQRPSLLWNNELRAKYHSRFRASAIALVGAMMLLLCAACSPGEPTPLPTPTPARLPPTPIEEPTPTLAAEDPYEPNDLVVQAFGPLEPASEYSAYISGADDADFFYFDIQVPATVHVVLTDMPAGADYDLYLVTGEEDILSSSTNSDDVEERIEYTTSSVGVFYILVLPFHNFSETEPYTLRLGLSPAPTPSGSDRYEPNDTFQQAAGPLLPGQVYEAYVWDEGDRDNYMLQLGQAVPVAVDLTQISTVADYDLFLYNEVGELLASSKTVLDREHIEQYLAPGTYYIAVQSFGGFSRNEPYALQVTLLER
jgi:hypothetical protein